MVQVDATSVRLNPSLFSSDLWDFLAALDRGDVERAVELHEGAFLEGFALPELPEFTRWIEEERADRSPLRDALEAAAARASVKGGTATRSSAGRRWRGSTR